MHFDINYSDGKLSHKFHHSLIFLHVNKTELFLHETLYEI